ncbi:MAG: sigma-54-dependent Fis family transcriptional regulator, partial [Rubrivivax sp.]|nr:sigma-54-dependent Fis family transcriptional regulator [Rubrivivax sp.]
LDDRPGKRDLIIVDCATIVPELSGSEFFGHERGAFTGAVTSRDGAFALANGGTLFLDEVGELPLNLQAQLLRVIQEGTFKRVGGNAWHETNFRLVCATNKNLHEKVLGGEFRRDLYYRIATATCHLPPLRERPEDILPLARHFIQLLKPQDEVPDLDEAVQGWLLTRDYPGNVRELKQLVTCLLLTHVGLGPITVGDIPEEERPRVEEDPLDWCDPAFDHAMRRALYLGLGLKEVRKTITEKLIRIAVAEEQGNIQRAARRLGVTPRALQIRRAGREQSSAVA